jgi:hypothetical protein
MALVQNKYDLLVIERLNNRIKKLIKSGVIKLDSRGEDLSVAFYHDVHISSTTELEKQDFKQPEGLRCFLVAGSKVHATIEFYYTKARNLRLSHVTRANDNTGNEKAFLALERLCSNLQGRQTVEFIKFPSAGKWYLLLRDQKKERFFVYTSRLRELSRNRLLQLLPKEIKPQL